MSQDITPAGLTPAAGLPVLPPGGIVLPPGATSGVPSARRRVRPFPPDAIDFYARCPGCGFTATWHEKREDTHTEITIDCRICDRRARARLAKSA